MDFVNFNPIKTIYFYFNLLFHFILHSHTPFLLYYNTYRILQAQSVKKIYFW